MRVVDCRLRDLVQECLTEERCATFLRERLEKDNMYVFHDTSEWEEATQTDPIILQKVIRGGGGARTTASGCDGPFSKSSDRFPFHTLLHIMEVMRMVPMEAAIAYSSRYGRILIPQDEQVRCFLSDQRGAGEEPRWFGQIHDSCPCKPGMECQGCKLIDNIPARKDFVTTLGRTIEEGYSVDDFYTKRLQTKEPNVEIELKTYFPVSVPNLPPTLCCPLCRVSSRRTLFLTEVSYQSSETSTNYRTTPLTFTPLKSNHDPESKRQRRDATWKDRLFSKDSYPPPPYREDGIHKNIPIEHTSDAKSCISIHCENCKRFGLLAPAVPCHTTGFPCEAVRSQPQDQSLRDELYQADLGAVLVRHRCNAGGLGSPCNKAPLCHRCCFEIWHHVWEARPPGREHHQHAYLNNHGINFIVFCSSCRTCDLRLCHEHAWLSTVCQHT